MTWAATYTNVDSLAEDDWLIGETAAGGGIAINPGALGPRAVSVDNPAFGAVGDCTAPGTGTDDYAAFAAAIAYLVSIGGGVLYVSAKRYRLSQRLVFTSLVQIRGQGWSENPGIADGVTYTGVYKFSGSMLVYDAGVAGMAFYGITDADDASVVEASLASLGAASPYYEFLSARGSEVRDIMLYGGGGTNDAAHGIETRAPVSMHNVRCDYFAGDGMRVDASTGVETTPYGNASSFNIVGCITRFNRRHGVRLRGRDANVIGLIGHDSALNGGAGYFDQSLLGNTYVNCHAATNNQATGATRTSLETECPPLVDTDAGSYVATSAVGAHTYTGCYVESGQGLKASLTAACTVTGGNLASHVSHEDDCPAGLNIGNVSFRAPWATVNYRGADDVGSALGRNDTTMTVLAWGRGATFNEWTFKRNPIGSSGTWGFQYANSPSAVPIQFPEGEGGYTGRGYAAELPYGLAMGGDGMGFAQLVYSATAMPATGTYTQGDFILNRSPALAAGKVLIGWSRLTTGSGHVANTDWAACYVTNS